MNQQNSNVSLTVTAYGPNRLNVTPVATPEEVRNFLGDENFVVWVNVEGPFDESLVDQLGEIFQLHPLAREDVLHNHQRAKVEDYGDYEFVVARMVSLTYRLDSEQLSVFFGKNFVLTFQDKPGGDCLDAVRMRLRKQAGRIRHEKADYLAYAILDAVIDSYFPVVEKLGDMLDDLEEEILQKPDNKAPSRIHAIKRDLLALRRMSWPLRDAVNIMMRDTQEVIGHETRYHLRDCYDHISRLIDLVETNRELCADLMDVHLSTVSNRMNEVMKVLTIITAIFIPPSFIAAVYGMNFNPSSSPWNMPELNWFFGYPFALILMFFMMGGLLFFLRYKGWLEWSILTKGARVEYRSVRKERRF